MKSFLKISFWLVLLAAASVFFGLRSFQAFTREELVAVVECEHSSPNDSGHYVLALRPVSGPSAGIAQLYAIQGDQWEVGGEILKWHPWLNVMGIRTCHKLTRLSSRYLKAADELRRPRIAYDLNGGTSPFWEALYRFHRWIPFVEAVYGNSTHVMLEPGKRWGVYVTPSGYLIKSNPG